MSDRSSPYLFHARGRETSASRLLPRNLRDVAKATEGRPPRAPPGCEGGTPAVQPRPMFHALVRETNGGMSDRSSPGASG